ncbi:hypothetical protein [Rhizobium sp. SYY.PMSO]|uniref:hypothetical protein n=1 Tax=Rhizobium sp. SYY.PMSO TaxID=3382192 RepID=UPI00398FE62B
MTKRSFSVYPTPVSGGRQKRMALAMSPGYMLFDEAKSVRGSMPDGEWRAAFGVLPEKRMTVSCAALEMAFARAVSHPAAFLRHGVLAGIGRPERIFAPQTFLSSVH